MPLVTLLRRSLSAAASRDRRDQIKGLVLSAARAGKSLGVRSPPVDARFRRQSAIKLLRYTFPSWESPIVVFSREAESYVTAIRSSGYPRCIAGDESKVRANWIDGDADACQSAVVVLIDLVEWMSRGALRDFLSQLEAASPARIVASIPTYPECLFGAFERSRWPSTFERRSWWEEIFSEYGFDTERPPHENLPGLWPFIFRRQSGLAGADDTPHESGERVQAPAIIFVMPETQNAFRWVTESLAEELTTLGRAAAVLPTGAAGNPRGHPSPRIIAWPHYWAKYRTLAGTARPEYEIFVTNFEMKRRTVLTPWVEELRTRDSAKLAVSNFCRDVLIGLGVTEDRVHVVPHGYSPEFAEIPRPLPLATRKTFRILAVVNSHDPYRYGTDILLNAYRRAFRASDDVCLVIKDYGMNAAATELWFDNDGGPEILYYSNFLEKSRLASLYAACSAFAAPFRGEGFGMKILDAAVAGLPLLVPLYGGPLDYCIPELVQPIAFERRPVGKCLDTDEIEWKEDLVWCEPSARDLAERMRHVFENRDAAAARAIRLREIAIEQYSWEAAARKLLAIME